MVDIHCHMLPAADDGSSGLEESLTMARMAVAGGTDTVIVTPHCNIPYETRGNYRGESLRKEFETFRGALREAGIPLKIKLGAEILTTPEVPELIREGRLQTLADSRYLLMEFFFDEPLSFMDRMLGEVLSEGLIPVLAHPERYEAVQGTPSVIADWFEAGIIIQVNKGSIQGKLGSSAMEMSHWILHHGLAHAVASDAHSGTVRTPHMREIRHELERELGSEYTRILLDDNPARIAENRPVCQA